MENEKKVYETPVVTKVEFDASDRITASYCATRGTRALSETPTGTVMTPPA